MLYDAYSASADLVSRYKKDWQEFDTFVFENPDFMNDNGFVSLENKSPVGFMSWDPRQLPDFIEIGHNCIITMYKGTGKGKAQLLYGLECMKQLHPKKIIVRTGNIPFFLPAQRMYESAGFIQKKVSKRYDNSGMEIIEYELEL